MLKYLEQKFRMYILTYYVCTQISEEKNIFYVLLPPFRNIRCFSFVKLMYLDNF
jgi:hypothetical protein